MIGGLGVGEILIIFFILVLIFGARKLPEIGKGLGEGINNFKNALTGGDKKALDPEKESKNEKSKKKKD